jgi:hypothetical protein
VLLKKSLQRQHVANAALIFRYLFLLV